MQQMHTYWGTIRTESGGFIRVTVQAQNPFLAQEMMKAMYREKLLTTGANLLN